MNFISLALVNCHSIANMWSVYELFDMIFRHLQDFLLVSDSKGTDNLMSAQQEFSGDFKSMPVSFRWIDSKSSDEKNPPKPLEATDDRSFVSSIVEMPQDMFTNFYMRTLGIKMIYPGATLINQMVMAAKIREYRSRLLLEFNGKRAKLLTYDGNMIDSMFIDRRGPTKKGSTLVICCEGNIGYYECGSLWTPLNAGYSVLGWNHPGFGESTGEPFPEQEVNAVDVVMKYAMEDLKFTPDNIILFGWSIGGFTASWAAMKYPYIKGLILDASFDHIDNVVTSKLPSVARRFWKISLQKNFNIDISGLLNKYYGPVLVIRRTKDIVVSDFLADRLQSNRANHIIFNLFQSRFPSLMSDQNVRSHLWNYLSTESFGQEELIRQFKVSEEECRPILRNFMFKNGFHFPVMIGNDLDDDTKKKLIFFLASKHLLDFEDHHSTPLPAKYFMEPWDLLREPSRISSG
ncbi:phosphatidylserine lipase ABHD16A-like [Brevipalpus obovatus]|uniref:phosphatidylserine lipase ABHD16A-like n=1 Tax=Brevipalpus obovatus TaxID=246614 RepID=UPI003D9DE804